MNFQVTARHEGTYQRYHAYLVDAPDAKAALQAEAPPALRIARTTSAL